MPSRARTTDMRALPQRYADLMHAVRASPGVAGALLVTREGACVVTDARLPRPELSAAMAAAVLSAAETITREFGLGHQASFRLQAAGRSINGVGAGDSLMLLTFLQAGADAEASAAAVDLIVRRQAERSARDPERA